MRSVGERASVLHMPYDQYIDQIRQAKAVARPNKRGVRGVCRNLGRVGLASEKCRS